MEVVQDVSGANFTQSTLLIEQKIPDSNITITNTNEQQRFVSTFYSFYGLVSNIAYTFYEKLFPKNFQLLDKAEEQIYRYIKNKLYRFYVEVDRDTKVWTTSSIPQDIMIKYKNKELTNDEINFYNLNKVPVLLIHGFCSGTGLWSMNIDHICDTNSPLFAIDMPGFAHSSRISFPKDPYKTEEIFLEAFEKWRLKMGLGQLIIIGHSMGGFLTTAYAIKYPQNVKHILLIDTWGYPDLKETVTEVIQKESSSVVGYHLVNRQGWFRVFVFLIKPFSPLALLRTLGSVFGPKLIQKTRPQFAQRYVRMYGENDFTTINNYIYCINAFNPTGEEAFRSLAHPLGWAKNPILPRIHTLPKWVSITFIYGSRSWISSESGFIAKEILKDNNVKVYVVDNAGHHVYADQPDTFGYIVQRTIRKYNKLHSFVVCSEPSSPSFFSSKCNGYKTNFEDVRADLIDPLNENNVIW